MTIWARFKQSLAELCSIAPTPQRWHLPVLAGCCVAVPGAIGAYFGNFPDALYACFSSFLVLYLPGTRLAHRMLTLVACAFGFIVCFTVGLLTASQPVLFIPTLLLVSWLVITICRYYRLPPPGSFFFIVLLIIAGVRPTALSEVTHKVGLIALGTMSTCLLAFLYSLGPGRQIEQPPAPTEKRINAVILEAGAIAMCITGSMVVAMLLDLSNPYWVPTSCAAILQGATFRMVWRRNIHRIWGTLVGLSLTSVLLEFEMSVWALLACIVAIQALVEFLVPRNYGLAVIFITPLTVFFAEATSQGLPDALVTSRFIDIVIGSTIGCIGGWFIHQTNWFERLEKRLDRLLA